MTTSARYEKRRGGRPALAPELRRDHQIRLAIRPSQMQDIEFIAEAWSDAVGAPISPSTAAWAMLSEFLSKARRETVRTPEINLVIAASRKIVREFDRTTSAAGRRAKHDAP